jgi:hypothetical protein
MCDVIDDVMYDTIIIINNNNINSSAFCKTVWDPIYASTVVQNWSKVNEWREDGFVKAETCRIFE